MSFGPDPFRIACAPDERLVQLSGEIDLAVGRALAAAFDRIPAGAEVVVDTSGVTFIDSTGLAKLVEAGRRHHVVLRGASRRLRLLMELTGLGETLSIVEPSMSCGGSGGTAAGPVDAWAHGTGSEGWSSPRTRASCGGRAAGGPTTARSGSHVVPSPRTRPAERRPPAARAVTFRCTTEASYAVLVAEFTDWAADPIPMRRCPDGFEVTVELEPGRRYRYKYLLDGEHWVNDVVADAYEPNEFGGYDSVREL